MSDSFMIVVLPDSQRYVEDGFREEKLHCLEKQIEWIIENKDKQNICFVTHVGDTVHHRDKIGERRAFFEQISRLKNVVPFGFCAGNHDTLFGERAAAVIAGRGKVVDAQELDQPAVRAVRDSYVAQFRKEAWWISDCDDAQSNAQVFTALGRQYLAIHLEYGPSDATMAWANALAEEYRNCPVLLTTHMFLTPEEPQGITRRESRLSTYQNNMVGEGDNAGIDIWEKLIVPHENVKWVVCGHYADERYMALDAGNRIVHAMQSDYELDKPYGGNGWMRLLTFTPSQGRLEVETYSPVLDAYRLREKSHFVITE